MIDLAVLTFGLILARVSALVSVLPILAGPTIPRTVKTGLALAVTVFYFNRLGPDAARTLTAADGEVPAFVIVLALAREAVLGAFLGLALSLILLPVRVAGSFLGQEMGLNMGQLADPSAANSSTIVTQLFEMTAAVLFLGMDGHHWFLGALDSTFQRVPLGGSVRDWPLVGLITGIQQAEALGLILVAPLAAALFLTSIVMALLSRVAQQLHIFSLGLSLRVALGLVGLLLLLPDFVLTLMRILSQMSRTLEGLV